CEIEEGRKDLGLVTAADPAQEALAIALALRESLETPGRTAALVTPDRNLARRVAAEMARWNIAIDDSAGRPLAHTAAGSFLCLLVEAAEARFAPVPLLALLKHPFARRGLDHATFRARARELDRWCLRGPRPDAGLAGITKRIETCGGQKFPPPPEALALLKDWWSEIAAILAPLEVIYAQRDAPLPDLIAAHITAAEVLACDEKENCILWANADGEQAAILCAALGDDAQDLPPIEPGSYAALFRHLAMKTPVRAAFGRHPRLAILGPLEARLQRFDLTILGGLNEGSWPGSTSADPWFSRPMRETLGLEQPERSIGLAAHDFAMLAAGPEVLITRAAKVEGAPTIASRWLQRMLQLTAGLGLAAAEGPFAGAARRLSHVQALEQATPPMPKPPTEARPRKLSVTEVETWLRDPYAIYAKHVLKLEPWDPLDAPIGPLERGLALHRALELYKRRFPTPPEDAVAQLMAIADQVFEELAIPKAMLSVWRPRFECAARWFAGFERERAGAITQSALETKGERTLVSQGGSFTLRGVADRIDILQNGRAAILDYKSGKPPSNPQVKELLAPQLPLEGAILKEGGFPGLGPRETDELLYLHISGRGDGGSVQPIPDVPQLIERAWAQLMARVARFDDPATPYPARVRPFSVDSEGDYDHLARVRAWAIIEKEEE
ncbi:MAG TPA: double-strand break repair protein AddB, partial [Rhizomicrobium sp.]|nr:double-strand break repair protein AddB [Rhizomicrobium sp.]